MKKTSFIILLALVMALMVFAVACDGDSPPPSDPPDSIPLDKDGDGGDDNEAARGSATFNFDNITFDDWLKAAETDDASFKKTAIDLDSLVSADGK